MTGGFNAPVPPLVDKIRPLPWNVPMSKAKEIRELSDEQLALTLTDNQRELFNLRFQCAAEKRSAPSEMRKLRRNIARIMTIQQERTLANTAAE